MSIEPMPQAPPTISPALAIPPEVAQLINAQREENARLRQAQTEAQVGQALGDAIAEHGDRLRPHAARHLAALLRPGVKLVESGGQSVVAGPKLESVSQYVRDALATEEFGEFVRPRGNPGGGTQLNPHVTYPVNPSTLHQPIPDPSRPEQPAARTLGEQLVNQVVAQRAAMVAQGQGDPSRNPGLAFGLKPIK